MTKLFDKINDILDETKMKIQKLIEPDMKTATAYWDELSEDWGEHIPLGISESNFEKAIADRDQEWRDKIEAKIKEKEKALDIESARHPEDRDYDWEGCIREQIYILKELLEEK